MPLKSSSSSRSIPDFRSLAFWAICLLAVLSCVAAEETESPDNSTATTIESNLTSISNETAIPTASLAPSSAPTILDCEALHYDCFGCLQAGCFWCPTDGLCFKEAEYIERDETKQKLWPDRFHNCKTPESFTQTTCTAPFNHFDDPLYSAQNWIFAAVKVVPAWERGYYGKGVRVRVNDDGIETTHPEFLGRLDIENSCPNGTAASISGDHGMTVASMLGAAGNNSDCGVGIAPEVTISSCNSRFMDREEMLTYELDTFDISQNSWAYEGCGKLSPSQLNDHPNGRRNLMEENECVFQFKPFEGYLLSPCDKCNFTHTDDNELLGEECIDAITKHCDWYPVQERRACLEYLDVILNWLNPASEGECHFGVMPEKSIDAFTKGVTEGRDGKGIIYVFAAGNEFPYGDDTNFQGFGSNTRFTIPVAAVGKPGNISSFSTPGASVFVAAPGGDFKQSVTPIVAASNDGTCEGKSDGTSFAAPVVSGVIALMLEANPELTWRDVQQILARTAQVKNDGSDPTFATNGAGRVHSNRYGFGIVNADKAVEMAENWINIGKELSLMAEGKGKEIIIDDRLNATHISLFIDSGEIEFEAETVYLYVKVKHSSRGHLRIDLTSPSGMLSVMSPGQRPESQQTGWMKFTSVRYWDENPNGEWVISIIDTTPGTVNECLDHTNYTFPYDEDGRYGITCGSQDYALMSQFCADGALDPDGYQATLCKDAGGQSGKDACDRLERFESQKYNGLTGPEACCVCGGGFHPSKLPETVVEWKLVVYGHEKLPEPGFLPGIGNGVQLGDWGDWGGPYPGKRFKMPGTEELEAYKEEKLGGLLDRFGGIRGRNRRG